jgi:hypothetical protein
VPIDSGFHVNYIIFDVQCNQNTLYLHIEKLRKEYYYKMVGGDRFIQMQLKCEDWKRRKEAEIYEV